jgi:predicted RNA-binding protein YlxR (DUF448 family)/ribosomal protein L30E
MNETLATKARERRDIVSGEVMDEDRLIRFVIGPEGLIIPDLARKLPGRGVWVAANRQAVQIACAKNLFARSLKAKALAAADLADQVESLLLRRLLAGLGLARKAGDLITGFEKTLACLRAGRAEFLIEAADGAEDGRRKLMGAAQASGHPPRLIGLFESAEMGLALGGENVIHTAFLAGRGAERWSSDVERLTGFRPLYPERWREDP